MTNEPDLTLTLMGRGIEAVFASAKLCMPRGVLLQRQNRIDKAKEASSPALEKSRHRRISDAIIGKMQPGLRN